MPTENRDVLAGKQLSTALLFSRCSNAISKTLCYAGLGGVLWRTKQGLSKVYIKSQELVSAASVFSFLSFSPTLQQQATNRFSCPHFSSFTFLSTSNNYNALPSPIRKHQERRQGRSRHSLASLLERLLQLLSILWCRRVAVLARSTLSIRPRRALIDELNVTIISTVNTRHYPTSFPGGNDVYSISPTTASDLAFTHVTQLSFSLSFDASA